MWWEDYEVGEMDPAREHTQHVSLGRFSGSGRELRLWDQKGSEYRVENRGDPVTEFQG